jgi:hypothetical protein
VGSEAKTMGVPISKVTGDSKTISAVSLKRPTRATSTQLTGLETASLVVSGVMQ